MAPDHGALIQWTGRDEFKVVDTSAVALLWQSKGAPPRITTTTTTVEDFRKSLEDMSSLERLEKVKGKENTFRFLINIQKYIIDQKCGFLTKLQF